MNLNNTNTTKEVLADYGLFAELQDLNYDPAKTNALGKSAMLARSGVPHSHCRVADSFQIVKKIYGFPVVQAVLTNAEKQLLAKFDFNLLEYTTIKQINEEIELLKEWSHSRDSELSMSADKLIQIRGKELKGLIAKRYVTVSNEIYSGYKALERYFEEISKYHH